MKSIRTVPQARARGGRLWWQESAPAAVRACYRTKGDALRALVADPHNAQVLGEWGGFTADPGRRRLAREHCGGEFDAVNVKHERADKRRACLLDDALWMALPPARPGQGHCVRDVDIEAMNEIGAAITGGQGGRLRLPSALLVEDLEARGRPSIAPIAEEYRLVDLVSTHGRRPRPATAVAFPDGCTIRFSHRLATRSAIRQAVALRQERPGLCALPRRSRSKTPSSVPF